jgi:nitrite reductase/ring-hydroxylating ferredoxin subunit
MPKFVRVAELQDIPEGQGKIILVHDREIAIFHAGGVIHAVKNSCPHQGVGLDRGSVVDGTLTCPGHGWQFDVSTGDCLDRPDVGVRCYRAEIRGSSVWVELP